MIHVSCHPRTLRIGRVSICEEPYTSRIAREACVRGVAQCCVSQADGSDTDPSSFVAPVGYLIMPVSDLKSGVDERFLRLRACSQLQRLRTLAGAYLAD